MGTTQAHRAAGLSRGHQMAAARAQLEVVDLPPETQKGGAPSSVFSCCCLQARHRSCVAAVSQPGTAKSGRHSTCVLCTELCHSAWKQYCGVRVNEGLGGSLQMTALSSGDRGGGGRGHSPGTHNPQGGQGRQVTPLHAHPPPQGLLIQTAAQPGDSLSVPQNDQCLILTSPQ